MAARAHITDSRFHGGGYATDATRAIFADERRLQRWLEIEIVLAECQAELGMIPIDAAQQLERCLRLENCDLDRVAKGIAQTNHSLVPLLREASRSCGTYASQFLHYGATTQDIQDTGQSLEMRDVLDVLASQLGHLIEQLARMAAEHQDTLMVGRTHARAALPTVFGLKVAGWVDELMRDAVRLKEMRPRVLAAQLFGGVGTMAALGEQGIPLMRAFADRLGLAASDVSWHVSRDRVVEFVSGVAIVAGTLARIADEVRLIGRPEFDELREHFPDTDIGSSTMPFKKNPEMCEQIVVLARLAKAQVSVAFDAMVQEHERDYRGTRVEWVAVADVSHYTVAAAEIMRTVVGRLEVRVEAMERNLRGDIDAITAEPLMMDLGKLVGKARAYSLVAKLFRKARERNCSVVSLAIDSPEITTIMPKDAIRDALDPRKHVGAARLLIERVVTRATGAPSPEGAQRARAQRYKLPASEAQGGGLDTTRLSDISRGGFCINAALEVGSQVSLQISLPGLSDAITVEGETRWSLPKDTERGPCSGVEFSSMRPESAQRLTAFLEALVNPSLSEPPARIVLFATSEIIEQVYNEQLRAWQHPGHASITALTTCQDVASVCDTLRNDRFSAALLDVRHERNVDDIVDAVPADQPAIVICTEMQRHRCARLKDSRFFVLTEPIHYGRLIETISLLLNCRNQERRVSR